MAGFIGSHLAEFLLEKGHEVHGTMWERDTTENLKEILKDINLINCDIRKADLVRKMIDDVKPERIFHLAAQSFPTVSWEEPERTLDTNVLGCCHLFEAVKEAGIDPIILVACSSAEYGFVTEDEVPVNEEHSLKPLHPYGVSKVAQDFLAYQYFKNFGMKSLRVRIFNTTGPRKIDDVCSDFTKQVAEIEKKGGGKIKVGNLESRRDITGVKDMVEALWLATEKGEIGEVYNLCSGRAHRIGDILDELLKLSEAGIEVEIGKEKLRPTDEPIIMGDNAKFRKVSGWEPRVPIKKTLGDMLDYWRGT